MFKYFKYPTGRSQQNQITQDASALVKAKAMITYAADVLFGNSPDTAEIPINFDPQFGQHWRQRYERQFGRRGVNLVALLGQGYSKEELSHYGAMSKDWSIHSLLCVPKSNWVYFVVKSYELDEIHWKYPAVLSRWPAVFLCVN